MQEAGGLLGGNEDSERARWACGDFPLVGGNLHGGIRRGKQWQLQLLVSALVNFRNGLLAIHGGNIPRPPNFETKAASAVGAVPILATRPKLRRSQIAAFATNGPIHFQGYYLHNRRSLLDSLSSA